MSADQLEAYIDELFRRQEDFGALYVQRQVEWAQAELESLLEKSSSIGAAEFAPPVQG